MYCALAERNTTRSIFQSGKILEGRVENEDDISHNCLGSGRESVLGCGMSELVVRQKDVYKYSCRKFGECFRGTYKLVLLFTRSEVL